MKGIRSTLMALLACAALSATAFQKNKPSWGKFGPEQSQAQVAQQQAHTGKLAPVGQSESAAPAEPVRVAESGDAGNSISNAEAVKARSSFKAASRQVAEAKKPNNSVGLIILIFGALLLGAVAFKSYTDKAVPLPKRLQ